MPLSERPRVLRPKENISGFIRNPAKGKRRLVWRCAMVSAIRSPESIVAFRVEPNQEGTESGDRPQNESTTSRIGMDAS